MPGLISPAPLEQIRAASDIVEVIGGYLPLKRAGANFVALCPFHREKSPSFNVHPARQIFHCFGCHKGGDVFTFVKEYESIGFLDAVRRLAERANIVLEFAQSDAEQQSRHLKDRLLEVHEQICRRWQNALANEAAGQPARDYLAQRGVSGEAVKLFRLGAAPEAWDDTVNWAKSKGHDLALVDLALEGGLQVLGGGAVFDLVELEVLDLAAQRQQRLLVGVAVNGLRPGRGAEETGCLGVVLCLRLLGKGRVAVRGVRLALKGGVEVVERLRRDVGFRRNNRRKRGADHNEEIWSHNASNLSHGPLESR